MFTGIIEAVGTLAELRRQGDDMALTVHAPHLDFSEYCVSQARSLGMV